MEQLLHYIWKHKLFPLTELRTAEGQAVEVIDVGLANSNAGPDFFNAKVKIGGEMWVGNIEIHDKSTDWYTHGHDRDERYNNVILHIAETINAEVRTADGKTLPQMRLEVPVAVAENYRQLLTEDHYPPCHRIIPELKSIMIHSWMSALQTERLEQKTVAITRRVADCDGSWEDGYFRTLARNYGFGVNGDAFEAWAKAVPLKAVAHHRNDEFQVEAIFMGQAGLLDPQSIPERHREAALADPYFNKLAAEYRYLAHKFNLKPMDARLWRFLRLRPQNFPHIRIAQLVSLYCSRKAGLSDLMDCDTIARAEDVLRTHVTPYWRNHYMFGLESAYSEKSLSASSLRLLLINTAVPVLFAYGRYKSSERLVDRAYSFLEQLSPEDNHIIRMWKDCGLNVKTAADSQALIQLKTAYCDRKDCLRCRIGYEYFKSPPLSPQGGKPSRSASRVED